MRAARTDRKERAAYYCDRVVILLPDFFVIFCRHILTNVSFLGTLCSM